MERIRIRIKRIWIFGKEIANRVQDGLQLLVRDAVNWQDFVFVVLNVGFPQSEMFEELIACNVFAY